MTGNVLSPDRTSINMHIAAWSLDEAAVAGPTGTTWVVTGSSGALRIRGEGPSRTAAWWAAVEQVAAGGMLKPRSVPPATGG